MLYQTMPQTLMLMRIGRLTSTKMCFMPSHLAHLLMVPMNKTRLSLSTTPTPTPLISTRAMMATSKSNIRNLMMQLRVVLKRTRTHWHLHLSRCFQHWLLTMRALLRSVAACAALNPKAATPKQVGLMQLGESIVWFALEASQPPSKLEGRIVSLDNIGSVKYTLPGIRRANIIDVAPGIAAGSHRFLLHTRFEHIKPADLRIPIDDSTLMVN